MSDKHPFAEYVEQTLLPMVNDYGLNSLAVTDTLGNKASIKRTKHGILRVTLTLASDVNPMKQ